MDTTISTVADLLWAKICEKVRKSVVFIDDLSAESLHWAGGLERLLCAGVSDVKQLSSFESGSKNQKKAVFITSSLLFDLTTDIIRDILQSSSFQYVIVITNMSSAIHLWKKTGSLEGDDQDVFFQFEEKLLEWMGDMNYTAEVVHLPHSIAAITSELFVTPSVPDLFPFLPHEYKKLEMRQNAIKAMKPKSERKPLDSLADLDATMLPDEFAESVKSLVCSMNGLLEAWKLADECYSLGHTSRIVASELASYPPARNRRKAANKRASVVFIDRTLDVASACGNHGDTLMDRVMEFLPRLHQHRNDRRVDMTPLTSLTGSRENTLVPGCLAHAPDDEASTLLSHFFTLNMKDSTTELNQLLVHSARKAKLPVTDDKPGRVTAERLNNHVKLFKNQAGLIRQHSGLLQLSLASIQTLCDARNRGRDALQGVERLMLLGQEEGETACAEHLIQALTRTGPGREFSVDQFLSLLVYIYSVYGDAVCDTAGDEREIMQKLQKCILSHGNSELSPLMVQIFGDAPSKETVKSKLGEVFASLKALGRSREHLKRFRELVPPSEDGVPPQLQPLLLQTLSSLLDPSKPDLVDIEYRSGGIRDYLKTGFSLFMNVSKPRPSDCPVMIVYVIGGVTSAEARILHQMALKSNTQMILGGTKLISQMDVLESLFVHDRTR